jgi:phosphatidylserine decarboxylase
MRIDPAGWPFVLGAVGLALILPAYPGGIAWAVPGLVLAGFFLFFFRDPHRATSAGPSDVVSPADGRVVVAGDPEPGAAPPGTWRQLSIFLSPMDVHINRVPIAGRVLRVEYKPGRFLPAYKREAATENERNEMWIDHAGQTVVCRQVVGILARRIVCRVPAGAEVRTGDRFGVMKFGSRIDLFLPPTATIAVKVGDRVESGLTVVARLAEAKG